MKLVDILYMKNLFKFLVIFAFALCFNASQTIADDMVVVSFDGAYGKIQLKHMINPYAKKTGHNLIFKTYSGGVDEIRSQIESGKIEWDVVDIEMIDLERACAAGYLEEIPWSVLPDGDDGAPKTEDFTPTALMSPCGIGIMIWSIVFAYDTSKVGDEVPKTIADFFDVKKFPGKRALRSRPQVNLEWALIADGVDPYSVTELLETKEGQEQAFKKLDTIKEHVVWYDDWVDTPKLVKEGKVAFIQSTNGRLFNIIEEDSNPFKVVWDSHLYDIDVWSVLKGSKNKKLAFEFIAFASSSKPISGMADLFYGPTRRSSIKYINSEVVPKLPTSHMAEGYKVDQVFWANYGDLLEKKFDEWLNK
jgi:putative spermidine/putrescine transport system substrate-binding protein